MKNRSITVRDTEVSISTRHAQDYISLTDMVRNFDGGSALIEQWLKNKDTVLFLGVWEQLNNPGFNSLEFEGIRNGACCNIFPVAAGGRACAIPPPSGVGEMIPRVKTRSLRNTGQRLMCANV